MPAVRLNPAINFYATPAEVAGWVRLWKKQHDLCCVFGRVYPTPGLTQDVDWEEAEAVRDAVERYGLLYFRTDPIDMDVTSVNQIPSRNPDLLHIVLPSLTSKGLMYGSLGSVSKKPEVVAVWQEIARELVDRTASGVWFAAPRRRHPIHAEDVRYSDGAASLWRGGTALPGAGKTTVVRLDAPHADTASQLNEPNP
jgi:hypothetical protein